MLLCVSREHRRTLNTKSIAWVKELRCSRPPAPSPIILETLPSPLRIIVWFHVCCTVSIISGILFFLNRLILYRDTVRCKRFRPSMIASFIQSLYLSIVFLENIYERGRNIRKLENCVQLLPKCYKTRV